jgi:voltage-gated potassium channel
LTDRIAADAATAAEARAERRQRWRLLLQLEAAAEAPLQVLGFVWLVLLVLEFTAGLGPFLEAAGYAIWAVFVLDFLARLAIAPDRARFLRRNALTVASLLLPAFRMLRVARALRVARGVRLVKVLGSLNRGLGAARATMRRRGLGYVVLLTAVVVVVGAAGLYALERGGGSPLFASYGEALFWTARVAMTIGTEGWPATPEGRLLGLVVAVHGYAVFGYVTATFAGWVLGRDAADPAAEVAGAAEVRRLEREVARLTAALERGQRVGRGVSPE